MARSSKAELKDEAWWVRRQVKLWRVSREGEVEKVRVGTKERAKIERMRERVVVRR